MTMAAQDRLFSLKRTLTASRQRVFTAWTDPAVIRRWLAPGPCTVCEVENDLREGGDFRIVSRSPDGAKHTITGRYLVLERDARIQMTWLYHGPLELLDGLQTLLEVQLLECGPDRTEVILTQSDLPSQTVQAAFEADWPTCLEKLQRDLTSTLQ